MPCEEREWTLEGRKCSKKSDDSAGITIKQCEKCYAVYRPAPACPYCGHVPETQHREVQEVEGELREIDPAELRRQQKREQGAAHTVEALTELRRKRGMKNPAGWARHVYNARVAKRMMRA